MSISLIAYEFRDAIARRGKAVVCVVASEQVQAILGLADLSAAFLGHVVYADEKGNEYVGVWGARNAPRLRELLREHGAVLRITRSAPPGASFRYFQTRPGARG